MADNNITDLNLVKVEDVDYEEIIKMETEVVGGSWDCGNMEMLQNENEDWNLPLGNPVEQLLNKNSDEVCENCNAEYKDYCMNCRHLIHIFDKEVKVGTFLKAMRSIPYKILKIKGSLMEGYGVYALRNIPKGVKFGPFEGLETVKRRNKYLWKIKYLKLVEADGEDYCNWMKFINCATTQNEQNLIALQFMGKIYYKTLRQIQIGEELLIYYSNDGYNHLELSSIRYFQPDIEPINENIFKCPPCCFGFSEEKYLVNHNRVCSYKKTGATEVNTSTGINESEGHTKSCERKNNRGLDHPKDNENKELHENVGLNGEEKVLTTGSLKMKLTGHQKNCYEKNAKSKKQKSEHVYLCKTTKESTLLPNGKKYAGNYKTKKLTLKRDECSYAAVRKYRLLCHIKSPHTMEKPYKCDKCSYAAVRKEHLLSHIRFRHTMEKPYKCNECSYAAVRKDALLSHIRFRHTMDKPYKCNDCSYASVEKFQLLRHIKSRHTMEQHYKCNECSYATVQKSNLVNHIKHCHTIEKPYKCNDCSYASVEKRQLLRHIKSRHTIEQPLEEHYKCNECSYVTVQKSNLLRHIKNCHTIEKPHKCNECCYAAVQKSNLLRHIKSRHTISKKT